MIRLTSPLTAPPPQRQTLAAAREQLRKDVAEVRKALIPMLDKVTVRAQEKPFTSIIVEDTSARFVGLAVALTLSRGGPLSIPVVFARPQSLASVLQKAGGKDRLGEHPLVVTEYICSGQHMSEMCTLLASQGMAPTVACMLQIMSRGCGSAADRIQQAGARSVLIGQATLAPDHPVFRNRPLHGVTRHGETVVPWKSSSEEAAVKSPRHRQQLVNESRALLRTLVTEYLVSHKEKSR